MSSEHAHALAITDPRVSFALAGPPFETYGAEDRDPRGAPDGATGSKRTGRVTRLRPRRHALEVGGGLTRSGYERVFGPCPSIASCSTTKALFFHLIWPLTLLHQAWSGVRRMGVL